MLILLLVMTEPEKRTEPRKRTLKNAQIVFNNRRSTIDCTVRNLSAHGALLLVPNIAGIPSNFDLHIDDASHASHIVRTGNGSLGVAWS